MSSLVTVKTFRSLIDAQVAKTALESWEIHAFVKGEHLGNIERAADFELQVPEDQAERATELLEAQQPAPQTGKAHKGADLFLSAIAVVLFLLIALVVWE